MKRKIIIGLIALAFILDSNVYSLGLLCVLSVPIVGKLLCIAGEGGAL